MEFSKCRDVRWKRPDNILYMYIQIYIISFFFLEVVLAKANYLVQKISRQNIFRELKLDKARFSRNCFGFQSQRFSLLVAYNI